ncbi:MAG TPA: hypothetical protein VL201_00585, partial [Patescibacteria group bacterium]|nr:hypothetical protein [Patescibacteria group bacterium]
QCFSIGGSLWSISKMVGQFFQGTDNRIVTKSRALHNGSISCTDDTSIYAHLRAVPTQCFNSLLAIPVDLITVIMNGDLFKSMGMLLGHCVLISITNFAIELSLNKVVHRHTIGWYVQTHAPYQQTILLCIKQIENYEQMLLKNDHKVYVEYDIMISMCNLLLKDLERVAAYMNFRIPTIEGKYQKDVLAIKTLFLNYVFDWRLQMHEILFIEKNISKLKLLLDQCYNEIDRMYNLFALYERHLKRKSMMRELFR